MTAPSQFDRIEARMPDLLYELGAPALPDYTDDLLARTATTRQRPRWAFLERWFPMGVIARDRIYIPRVPWRLLAVAALLVIALVVVLLVGSPPRRLPQPFGPAANGSLLIEANDDIYIRDSLTAEQRLLIGGSEVDFAPMFSRDGTKLTFLRLVEDARGSNPDVFALMLVNADGSGLREVVSRLVGPGGADWSPDGKHLVAELAIDGRHQIALINIETGTITPIHSELQSYSPAYRGPDGREIVFRGWVRDGEVTVNMLAIRPDGTGLRVLGPGESNISDGYRDPLLSPDGRYVVYSQFDDEGNYRVHRLEIDTGTVDVLQLGPDGGHQGFASYSPDGQHLLFHWISTDNQVQVMVTPADGSGLARPIGPPYPVVGESASLQQTFSPDGKLVLMNQGRDRISLLLDLETSGPPEELPWDAEGTPVWQRLAPQ